MLVAVGHGDLLYFLRRDVLSTSGSRDHHGGEFGSVCIIIWVPLTALCGLRLFPALLLGVLPQLEGLLWPPSEDLQEPHPFDPKWQCYSGKAYV